MSYFTNDSKGKAVAKSGVRICDSSGQKNDELTTAVAWYFLQGKYALPGITKCAVNVWRRTWVS